MKIVRFKDYHLHNRAAITAEHQCRSWKVVEQVVREISAKNAAINIEYVIYIYKGSFVCI